MFRLSLARHAWLPMRMGATNLALCAVPVLTTPGGLLSQGNPTTLQTGPRDTHQWPCGVRFYTATGLDLGKAKAKPVGVKRPLKPTSPMNKAKQGTSSKSTSVGKVKAKRVATKSPKAKKASSAGSNPDESSRKSEGKVSPKPEVVQQDSQKSLDRKEEIKPTPAKTEASAKSEATTRLAVRNLMKHHFITSADKIRERPNADKPLSSTNPQLYARLERQKEKEENARRLSALTVAGASPQDIERFRAEAQAIQELNSQEAGLSIGAQTTPTGEAEDGVGVS